MRVVGQQILTNYAADHADIRAPLSAWLAELEEADWKCTKDIKARYPSASFVGENRVIFNIKGNNYRVEVKVSFEIKVVLVTRIGTHSEYSKWKF